MRANLCHLNELRMQILARSQSVQTAMSQGRRALPILVRRDGDRLVLVHGLHRLEACKTLGEETIPPLIGLHGGVPKLLIVRIPNIMQAESRNGTGERLRNVATAVSGRERRYSASACLGANANQLSNRHAPTASRLFSESDWGHSVG